MDGYTRHMDGYALHMDGYALHMDGYALHIDGYGTPKNLQTGILSLPMFNGTPENLQGGILSLPMFNGTPENPPKSSKHSKIFKNHSKTSKITYLTAIRYSYMFLIQFHTSIDVFAMF